MGEVLLYSCDNVKHSVVYFKYPYVVYDSLVPLSIYMYFVNPLSWGWPVVGTLLWTSCCFAWLPHVMYWKSLDRKIHQLYLLRGGKYLKIWT